MRRTDNNTILLASTELADQTLVRQVAKQLDLRLVSSLDSRAAAASLMTTPPDLLILDLDILLQDGGSLQKLLRSDQNFASLPIVAISGNRVHDLTGLVSPFRQIIKIERPFYDTELSKILLDLLRSRTVAPTSSPPALATPLPVRAQRAATLPPLELETLLARHGQLLDRYRAWLTSLALVELPRDSNDLHLAISRDQGLSHSILLAGNTRYFRRGEPTEATTIAQVLPRLGTFDLGSIILFHELVQASAALPIALDQVRFWRHCLFVANLLPDVYRLVQPPNVEGSTDLELFAAALLHDLGILLMALRLDRAYLEVYRQSGTEGQDLPALERAHFNQTHCDLGVLAAQRWGLPRIFQVVCYYHHNHRDYPGATYRSLLKAIALCDSLADFAEASLVPANRGTLEHLTASISEDPFLRRITETLLPVAQRRTKAMTLFFGEDR